MPAHANAFEKALVALAKASVDFAVVGVFGANFYAKDASVAFGTKDLDVLLRPEVENLRAALVSLQKVGFRFEANGEAFVDVDDEAVLRNVISFASNIAAFDQQEQRVDLMMAMTGFRFDDVWKAAHAFRVGGRSIRVASLQTILEAKRNAGREKDLRFIEAYEARRNEFLSERPRSRKRVKK